MDVNIGNLCLIQQVQGLMYKVRATMYGIFVLRILHP